MNIIYNEDNEDDCGFYTLEKSTNNTFYVVEKNMHLNPDSMTSDNKNTGVTDDCDSKPLSTNTKNSQSMLPNFWIILKIQGEQQCQKENKSENNYLVNTITVNLYFHCR
jgi:hypothetical protein